MDWTGTVFLVLLAAFCFWGIADFPMPCWLKHNWGKWSIVGHWVRKGTTQNLGVAVQERSCSRCGKTQREDVGDNPS